MQTKRARKHTLANAHRHHYRPFVPKIITASCAFCPEQKNGWTHLHWRDRYERVPIVPPGYSKHRASLSAMPVEIIAMVLKGNGLIVQDLLRCMVLCRNLRFFLLSRGSHRVWKAAREWNTLLPVPAPRVGMTEHEWALFLFSNRLNRCVICSKKTYDFPASYTCRLNICLYPKCRAEFWKRCVPATTRLEKNVAKFLPSIELQCLDGWRPKRTQKPNLRLYWNEHLQDAVNAYKTKHGNPWFRYHEEDPHGPQAKEYALITAAAPSYHKWRKLVRRDRMRRGFGNRNALRNRCKLRGWRFKMVRYAPKTDRMLEYLLERMEGIHSQNWPRICSVIEPEIQELRREKQRVKLTYGVRTSKILNPKDAAKLKRTVRCMHCSKDNGVHGGRPFDIHGIAMHLHAKHNIRRVSMADILSI